jgi:hypothetical protein
MLEKATILVKAVNRTFKGQGRHKRGGAIRALPVAWGMWVAALRKGLRKGSFGMSIRKIGAAGIIAVAVTGFIAALSMPAFGDGGPGLQRGALARGEVKAPPPPPKVQPKAAPAATTPPKAAPIQPPAAPKVVAPPPAPVPAPPPVAVPPPAKVEPPKVETPPPALTAPDGARVGVINLDEGVMLNVPQGWAFWPPADAQAYLRRTQAAAPAGRILGVISPAELRPTDANFWGSIVAFNPIGRVEEARGERFTAGDFLDETRAARPPNAPRLIGFPVAPAFDPGRKAITWGERYDGAAAAAAERPLRLEHRLLGRRGVASLSTPAKTDQLIQFTALAPTLGAMLGFAPGNAYGDAVVGDPAPLFDLPGVITNRPKSAVGTIAAGPAGSGIQATPLTPSAGPSSPSTAPTADVAGGAAAAGFGIASLMDGWFQWIAAGVVLLAALPWIIFRRQEDDYDDDNLAPARD